MRVGLNVSVATKVAKAPRAWLAAKASSATVTAVLARFFASSASGVSGSTEVSRRNALPAMKPSRLSRFIW